MLRARLISLLLDALKQTSMSEQKKRNFLDPYPMIVGIADDILHRRYRSDPFSCFVVLDPKPREIFAPSFRDRIVHHFLVDNIRDRFETRYIRDVYSNIPGRGTHSAVKRLQNFIRRPKNTWFLKCDIANFFHSIDREILSQLFSSMMDRTPSSCKDLEDVFRYLAQEIATQDPRENFSFVGDKSLFSHIPRHKSFFQSPSWKGIPIGSLSSQFFANIYLNELDRFVKHILRVDYIRFVDDFVLLADDSVKLSDMKCRIEWFLCEKLHLSLHPNKSIIRKTSSWIDFLGYMVRADYLLVRRRNIGNFRRKMDMIIPSSLEKGQIYKIRSMIASYFWLFCFAQTFQLRKKLCNRISDKMGVYFGCYKKCDGVYLKKWK